MSHRSTILYLNNPRYRPSTAVMVAALQDKQARIEQFIASVDARLEAGDDLTDADRAELIYQRRKAAYRCRDVAARIAEYQESVL